MSGKKNGRPNILLLFSDQHNRRITRRITVTPSALSAAEKNWINRELADIYDDDNKVGRNLIKRLIDHPWLNYL